jgi:hypothetical protein
MIAVVDIFLGLPLGAVILIGGVFSPPAIAAEVLETAVILPINAGGIIWVANGCPKVGQ